MNDNRVISAGFWISVQDHLKTTLKALAYFIFFGCPLIAIATWSFKIGYLLAAISTLVMIYLLGVAVFLDSLRTDGIPLLER